jgi:hypothetical protein
MTSEAPTTQHPSTDAWLSIDGPSNEPFASDTLENTLPPFRFRGLELPALQRRQYDLRRPMTTPLPPRFNEPSRDNTRNPENTNQPMAIIDLTSPGLSDGSSTATASAESGSSFDLSMIEPSSRSRSTASTSTAQEMPPHAPFGRARRGPRFSREIIDITDDTPPRNNPPAPSLPPQSPEVQFISARRRTPPPPAPDPPNANDEDDFQIVRHVTLIREDGNNNNGPNGGRLFPDAGQFYGAMAYNGAAHLMHGVRRAMERIRSGSFQAVMNPLPGGRQLFNLPDMQYTEVGFDLGLEQDLEHSPGPQAHPAPPPAPEGFTRSPEEDEVLICPNCEEELCTGDDDIKQQVWAVKACGHVSCSRFEVSSGMMFSRANHGS